MWNYENKKRIDLEYKINEQITLKLENRRTFIYINGIRFIQCMRLTINIPKEDISIYDEVDSIDEAAKLYTNHLYQNKIVTGPMAVPAPNQNHDITPEQEFWGHCSNIQAWVENDYDTRILMSNISFPLLRELARSGDLIANKAFKEEIALRLESGYPSVVHYLLEEDYLSYFTPFEFKTIIETTKIVENFAPNPILLIKFLIYSTKLFPNQTKHVILKLVLLPKGENILMSVIAEVSKNYYYRIDTKFFNSIKDDLKDMSKQISIEHRKPLEKAILTIEEYLSEEEEKRRNKPTKDFYKVIVLGDPAVGKTELIARFASKFEEKYLRTVGVSIIERTIELKDYNATVNLMFWDIAGQPQFYMLHRSYFKDADGILLVFDLTRSSTFSNINNWYGSAVKYGLSGIPRILVGNNLHLKNEKKIILPLAERLSDDLNAPYYETSTLTGENIKKVFEKIAELVYLAPEREFTPTKKHLIPKYYEEPSNDNNRLQKPLDREKKLILLKEVVPSLKRKSINQFMELDKREKRALETTFKYFNESKVVYYKPEKSKTDLLSAIETGDLVVLTSKWKYPKILDFFTCFIIIFMFWWLLLVLPGAILAIIIMTLILIGYTGRIITFAIYFRHYYIVLDSQGIYYKKIGTPKFISWNDVVLISSYFQYYFFAALHHNERAIGLKLKSKKIVRFKEINYQFKYKFLMFEDAFGIFKFRRCPFYRLGLHRGQFLQQN